MQQGDIDQLLKRDPCPLLRLHLAGGQVFEISDSDQAVLGLSTVEILLPREDGRYREAVINLWQIAWIEVVSPTT